MKYGNQSRPNPPEQVPTLNEDTIGMVHKQEDKIIWINVAEAVIYCETKGLPRTQKTVRKWAHRSYYDSESKELSVRREDVDNGFRWVIETSSLDRKIEQELEFEARRAKNSGEPVSTTPDTYEPVHTDKDSQDSSYNENCDGSNRGEHVPTGIDRSGSNSMSIGVVEQLEARIDDLKTEVNFYREELRDRRQTTSALTDVIESFRLTATTNASRAQDRAEHRMHDIRPVGKKDYQEEMEPEHSIMSSEKTKNKGEKWNSEDTEFRI